LVIKRPMLGSNEIRQMQCAGISFGAHTVTHRDLTQLPAPLVEKETVTSQVIPEQALAQRTASFNYPSGRCDVRSLQLARQRRA